MCGGKEGEVRMEEVGVVMTRRKEEGGGEGGGW